VLLEADRQKQRRRNLRDAVAAVLVGGAVLTTSLVGYVVVNKPHWLPGGGEEEPAATAPAPAATPPAAAPEADPAAGVAVPGEAG
jgi:hypothetical protein